MRTEWLARIQGGYYLATGIWPLVHMRSFLAVTGPKRDLWLVETVGVLVGCMGLQLLAAPRRSRTLAVSAALGLAGMEAVHVARRTIGPVYLGDAALETALAALWLRGNLKSRGPITGV